MICNCVDNVDTSDISFYWKGETFNDNEPKNMEKKFIYDDYDEGGMKRNIPLLVTYLMLSVGSHDYISYFVYSRRDTFF